MRFNLLPIKEYWLHSTLSVPEVKAAISENVMEKQAVTIDFLSEYADKKIGLNRYFEGVVGEESFVVNHKTYSYGRSNLNYITILPLWRGRIFETPNGATIQVVCNAGNYQYLLVIELLLPMVVVFLSGVPFVICSVAIVFVWFSLLMIRRVMYIGRTAGDIQQLSGILDAQVGECPTFISDIGKGSIK